MSTAIAPLFTPGINKFFFMKAKRYPSVMINIFRDTPMSGRVLMRQQWQTYGPPAITEPLNPVHMDEIRSSFSSAYTPIKRTLGDLAAEEDWDDDEYGFLSRVIPSSAGAMGDIFMEKREWDMANYLAINAFSTASPVPHSPDGVSLINSAHPISSYNSGTTWSNTPSVPADLSATTYYAAYASMANNLEPNNYTIRQSKPKGLIYNPTIRAVAVQLAKGDWERASSNFNMNVAKQDALQLYESPHFRKTGATSAAGSNNGWILCGEDHGLVFANRLKFKTHADYDYNIQAYVWVSYVRYDIGHDHSYDIYGSPGI